MPSLLSPNFTRPQAVTRLKANLFGLFVVICIRYIFSPYIVLRRGLIELGQYPHHFVLALELFVTGVLAGNALQAFYYVQYPSPPPRIVPTTSITPAKPSSPLTRAYASPAARGISSPSPLGHSTSLVQSSNQLSNRFSTPTKSSQNAALSPNRRNSPLSASTASILNLPGETTPTRKGLFHDASAGGQGTGDYVVVNKDDQEWVDNVWKGVRGKGGRLGL